MSSQPDQASPTLFPPTFCSIPPPSRALSHVHTQTNTPRNLKGGPLRRPPRFDTRPASAAVDLASLRAWHCGDKDGDDRLIRRERWRGAEAGGLGSGAGRRGGGARGIAGQGAGGNTNRTTAGWPIRASEHSTARTGRLRLGRIAPEWRSRAKQAGPASERQQARPPASPDANESQPSERARARASVRQVTRPGSRAQIEDAPVRVRAHVRPGVEGQLPEGSSAATRCQAAGAPAHPLDGMFLGGWGGGREFPGQVISPKGN